MRSTNVTLKVPHAIWDEREELRKVTGAKSVNAMLVGGILYSMMHRGEHYLTNAIMELSPEAQDEVIAGVIKQFREGVSTKGSMFGHLVDESVERVANGKKVPRKKVVSEMIERLREEGRSSDSKKDSKK